MRGALQISAVSLVVLFAMSSMARAEDPAAPSEPVPVVEEQAAPAAAATEAAATPEAAPAPAPVEAASAAAAPALPSAGADQEVIEDYCREFASSAAEARTQHQKAELEKLRTEVTGKLKEVEEKTAALQTWIKKREDISAKASKELTKIYGQMEPDAAARQMEKLDPFTASAILRTLNAKRSSEILATMDITKASIIISTMAEEAAKKTGNES